MIQPEVKVWETFKETHTQEEVNKTKSLILRWYENREEQEESDIYDEELINEESELCEQITDLLFGKTYKSFATGYNMDGYDSYTDAIEGLIEDLYTVIQIENQFDKVC